MCRLLETILCIDGKMQNLRYHQMRVDAAFKRLFTRIDPIELSQSIVVPHHYSIGAFRIRIVYTRDILSVEYFPVVPRHFNSFLLVTDDSIGYECKYEDRSSLNAISEQKNGADEAIIIKNGCVTDTTISNLLFFDGYQWFTPDTPLLKGTMRQQLLDRSICIERRITFADLSRYTLVLMTNALLGFEPNNALPIHSIQNLNSFSSHEAK